MNKTHGFIGGAVLVLVISGCSLSGSGQETKVYDAPSVPIVSSDVPPHFDRPTPCSPTPHCPS